MESPSVASVGNRHPEMDVFKGILVVLVVVGHVIPQFVAEISWPGWRVLFFAIYSFHMQAFVFIAGFCSARLLAPRDAAADRAFVRRRAERLLLPYLVWGGLYFAARLIAPSFGENTYDLSRSWQFLLGYNPDGALWFLWTLFAATAIVQGCLRVCSPVRLTAGAVMLCALALWSRPWRAWPDAVNQLPLFVVFFALGLLARSQWAQGRPLLANPLLGAGTVLGWCLALTLHPLTVTGVPWYLPGVTSLLGTAAFLFLSVRLSKGAACLKAPFVFLSAYAMEIFILAEPVKVVCRTVFRRAGIPMPLSFAALLVLMLAVPIVLARYVLRGRWLQLLLLGKREQRKVVQESVAQI